MVYILPTFMKTREKDVLRDKVNSLSFFRDLRGNSITYILRRTFSEVDKLRYL